MPLVWINLPRDQKECDPSNQVLRSSKTPIVHDGNAELRILAGTYGAQKSSINTASPLLMMDVKVAAGGQVTLHLPGDFFVGTYVLEGAGTIGTQTVQPFSIALSSAGPAGTTELICEGGVDGLRFLLFAGTPINDPVSVDGFFVCCSAHRTKQAVEEFEGRTGSFAAGKHWLSKTAHPSKN